MRYDGVGVDWMENELEGRATAPKVFKREINEDDAGGEP